MKNKKILIAILAVLAVAAIIVGIVLVTNPDAKKKVGEAVDSAVEAIQNEAASLESALTEQVEAGSASAEAAINEAAGVEQ